MRIEIVSDGMGYDVRLSSADRRDFAHLLGLFKSCVADNCRRYDKAGKVWLVEKRAQGQLSTFIGMCEDAGAKLIQSQRQRPVVTLPAMVSEQKAAPAYLTVRDTDDDGQVLTYRAKQKAANRPAVIVTKHDRWASLRATIYGGAMKDEAKRLAFDYLMAGSLPGGGVRVSNRELSCTRLSFHLASEMAAWLAYQLSNSHNIIVGVMDGREHARFETTKENDGRIKLRQGSNRRAA
ncbi:MAG: hypothetical protein ACJ74G_24640 [Blastocatellia bacterium]